MTKKTTTKKTKTKGSSFFIQTLTFFKNRQTQTVIGSFLVLLSLFLLIAFISFFFSWKEDQSLISEFSNRSLATKNLLGKIGANLSHFFVYNGFGLAAFIIPFLTFVTGLSFLLQNILKAL